MTTSKIARRMAVDFEICGFDEDEENIVVLGLIGSSDKVVMVVVLSEGTSGIELGDGN